MNGKIEKMILLLTGITMIGSMCACDNVEGGSELYRPETEEYFEYNYEGTTQNTLHSISIADSGYKLIEDGECDYTLVFSATQKNNKFISKAIDDFLNIFEEATNVRLSSVSDADVSYDENKKYISVGDTSLLADTGLTFDKKRVGSNGYMIETDGRSLFVVGGGEAGTLWGVHRLLNVLFGYECLDGSFYYVDKGVTHLTLPDASIMEAPDIQYRSTGYGYVYNTAERAYNMDSLVMGSDIIVGSWHNTFNWLPKATYEKKHPNWYSLDGKQLCYTARGDEGEYNLMVDAMVESLKVALLSDPNATIITITQMDNIYWCECDACQALEDKYQTDAVSQLYFVNDVAEKIETWCETEQNGREVFIGTFAYYKTESAPVVEGADRNWKPMDETIYVRDNVAIWYAPLATGHFTQSYRTEDNYIPMDMMEKWSSIAKNIMYWTYATRYNNYLLPYNSWGAMKDNYKILLENNAMFLFDQGQMDQMASTGFSMLKIYLNSKLSWNVNADWYDLLDTFFDKYYGPASSIMREYFDDLTAYLYRQEIIEDDISGMTKDPIMDLKYWDKQIALGWREYVKEAYLAIEGLKEKDPELYQAYYDHISLEVLTPDYILLEYYSASFNSEELLEIQNEFLTICKQWNVTNIKEGQSIDGFLEEIR